MSRKRKVGAKREPNGRLSRADRREFAPTRIRRVIDNAIDRCGDPLFGSMLGQLALRNHIEAYHVAAGQRYAGLRSKYHSAVGGPRIGAGIFSFGLRANAPDPDTAVGQELSQTERDVIARMAKAEEVLSTLGRQASAAVADVCEDRHPGAWNYSALRAGLDGLARHFHLTPAPANVR